MFVLRGQDMFAGDTVRHYADIVEASGFNNQHAIECRAWAEVMDVWHVKKVPD